LRNTQMLSARGAQLNCEFLWRWLNWTTGHQPTPSGSGKRHWMGARVGRIYWKRLWFVIGTPGRIRSCIQGL